MTASQTQMHLVKKPNILGLVLSEDDYLRLINHLLRRGRQLASDETKEVLQLALYIMLNASGIPETLQNELCKHVQNLLLTKLKLSSLTIPSLSLNANKAQLFATAMSIAYRIAKHA